MRYLHFYYILLLIISAFSQSFQTHTEIPQDLKTKIHDTILKLKNNPTHLNTLQEWIKQPSFAGQESGVQQLIADRLKQLGFQIDMYEMDGDQLRKHPYFVSPRSDFNNSPIVVGVLKGESRNIEIDELGRQEAKAGRSIILNGHVDVVPVGDLNAWKISKDPFSGLVKDGRVYGRGSTDMKGGIFSSLIAIEVLKELNISLKGDLIFQSVVEEESGGSGTLSTIIRGYKADGAIIPEPTNMKIFPKQQGSAWFRITVYGLSAHGGTRYDGEENKSTNSNQVCLQSKRL
jgi:acetylornithine deacetylase